MRSFFIGLFFCGTVVFGLAQNTAFGIKGGLTAGRQRWDNTFERDMLLRYHGIAFIESASEDSRFALFAQGGYHIKGSAIRTPRSAVTGSGGTIFDVPAQQISFEYRNVSLTVGAKQRLDLDLGEKKLYYMFGIRGDYTINTLLGPRIPNEYDIYTIYYPIPEFVRKLNYGITMGGGIEIPFDELVGVLVEFTVNPDFSYQYDQPPLENIINPNPWAPRGNISLPQRRSTNLTFELSFGFRFLRKVIYID
ncbi:hypothetical protein [Haliscomenobacter hydrossis]|uniref:Outer membrane protein beta-barrel domain-containing protein n=1 Tax=Haliscomenobacter hydrossis (strain ATCC 27775 / DSM 1100 / LMG 10767 / O) TaxID=760192 RepID=F4KYM5_HALH1|nr:hypothetical protein [Haliscomenobacter hydrossis]AEE50431.1 hypothetical protein Halhy_2558 [Haliscomenobacter hydrossis DSM 1100]